ncbi:polysaccharide biosynthesis C-terminal domain-containing protein [Thomasclavelia ramosa]|uniref:polysaccharide biosynthesis C-terminal domain-containing protein n=1 Tax=Thomasclavelia ramosa TaxID=1547 RepID=UPI0032C008D1
MNTSKKGILNIITAFFSQILIIITGIIIPKLILSYYGSETNGLINSVAQILNYFSLFEAGVGIASLQALYRPVSQDDKDGISRIMVATHNFYKKAGMLYIIAVVVLAFVYPVFVETSISYFIIFFIIIFSGLGNSINFIYQGKYKILMQAEGYSYVINVITTVIQIAICVVRIILISAGFDIITVQISYFLICILQMLIYHIYIYKNYGWLNFKLKPNNEAISQKSSTLIHQISSLIFNSTDVLLLTLLTRDLKIVSVYTIYNMIVSMITTLISQVNSGFDFKLGQLFNTETKKYIIHFDVIDMLNIILTFTAISITYIFIVPFIRLYTVGITDTNYINSSYSLLFIIAPLLSSIRIPFNNMINYAGHFKKTQWRSIVETTINIVVSVLLIPQLGIYGALLGTIVALLYRTNDLILYAYKYLIKEKPYRTYKRIFSALVIFILVIVFVDNNIQYTSYITMLYKCFIYGVPLLIVYVVVECIVSRNEIRKFIKYYKKIKR